ncbi:MAG: ImmA/IrrE family metallo-endopeptidase [Clostridia bacterium]|nr:ImmA/IrrE family metallo-endopeptidase [Clostridia bacterium]
MKTEIILIICKNERKKNLADQFITELKDIEEIQNKSADEIYTLCGISKMMPISFDKITKTYKVNILGTDFSYISKLDAVKTHMDSQNKILGMVNIENDYANIYYNNNPEIDIPTQRFTIAHELAHCINHYQELSAGGKLELLGDAEQPNNRPTDASNDVHEYVCNKFARDFLIPTEMLRKLCNAMRKPSVSELANLFLVPEKEMEIKLNELGLV